MTCITSVLTHERLPSHFLRHFSCVSTSSVTSTAIFSEVELHKHVLNMCVRVPWDSEKRNWAAKHQDWVSEFGIGQNFSYSPIPVLHFLHTKPCNRWLCSYSIQLGHLFSYSKRMFPFYAQRTECCEICVRCKLSTSLDTLRKKVQVRQRVTSTPGGRYVQVLGATKDMRKHRVLLYAMHCLKME